MTISKICGKPYVIYGMVFDDREPVEFLVPISEVRSGQHIPLATRLNRLLSVGHRCRGDVGVVA